MEAIIQRLPPTDERVAWNTPAAINERLQRDMEENISAYAGASREELTARIHALNREWDIERVLETNAGIVILTSLFLGTRRDRKWLALLGLAGWFLIQHAIQGWCPPVSLFRRLSVRTRAEIEEEKTALRILRGDFTATSDPCSALAQARKK